LVRLATRLILEEALEAETRDALGRDYYERGAEDGRGYRNGCRTGRLKTAEGAIEFSAPQVAGRDEPFRSAIRDHAKGRTEALEELAVEMLARGLSVRDIEDAFRADDGRLLLSRTAVSELGEQLWRDYQDFATRDLSEHEIVYLFVDGIAERNPPRPAARAGDGGLGFHGDRHTGAAAPDGRIEGRCRDGIGVRREIDPPDRFPTRLTSGHARPRLGRSAAGSLRRCAGCHQSPLWGCGVPTPRMARPASRARRASAASRTACATSPPRSQRTSGRR
jgi:hypothetical protein